MGRRKKEAPEVHRENIADAAERLFLAKGTASSTMDDIAKEAGYSKATLYVYFENKEEIISFLALKSMRALYGTLLSALESPGKTRTKYGLLCHALLQYQETYPLYFNLALEEINIDFTAPGCPPQDKASFSVGEDINALLLRFLEEGVREGALRGDLQPLPAIFSLWGMLSGLIRMSAAKEKYIRQELKLTRQEYLEYGFDTLYRTIAA